MKRPDMDGIKRRWSALVDDRMEIASVFDYVAQLEAELGKGPIEDEEKLCATCKGVRMVVRSMDNDCWLPARHGDRDAIKCPDCNAS